ncbi:hypothetical protein RJT34_26043 [Clitoria ternatea]|uniref:Disease resistance protein RPS4B/Roq1-like leucine-rich repeats domain-containing protein n=1 Tax=Clitoria ternatea TaxID=43366 RepID=A0AAN9F8C5_CLITE
MAASSSSRYSPSSSFNYAFKYDVFLSFRGEDTRHGFTGHLYNNLYALTDFSLKPGFTCVKVLRFNKCPNVTHIPDVSSFINLEELSFSFCRKLSTIHESVGSLDNLKILDAEYCHKLRSFPSLMLPSLEKLELSGCRRLESFPEILGKMEHMRELNISGTRITELPPSFRNLTGLRSLSRSKGDCPLNGASFFNPNIITMPQLAHISAYLMNGWVFPEEDDGGKIVSSNIQSIHVIDCNLTDEFFLVLTRWFGNVKELTIYNEDLIIIPECVKELRFLETMCLNQCGNLLDMEGIPPKLEYFEADGIPSNTPLCRSTLLNQELHKAGNTMFIFPGDVIPEWFEHRSSGTSISFWFRNKLPHLVLCLLLTYSAGSEECPHLLELFLDINGTIYISFWYGATTYHTYLFGLKKVIDEHNLNEALSKNEWNRATVICLQHRHAPVPGLTIEGGFNVLEQENSMQDIRFTNPFTVSESQNPDNVNEDSSLCYQPR